MPCTLRIKAVAILLVAGSVAACAGCGGRNAPHGKGGFDITGYVKRKEVSASANSALGTILVEAEKAAVGNFDIASVTVNRDTEILEQYNGRTAKSDFSRLAVGLRVGVEFTGPVAESYPPMATARRIVILPAMTGPE